jgi:NAD(P)-dependent dehydrogenase (short-subunit alcohol dehydrogenase family)
MPDRFSLEGKVAVVTGAAGLLGVHHCAALAEAGAHVVATDLHGAPLVELTRRLAQAHDAEMLAVECDVADAASVAALRDGVLDRFAQVDLLVNNAAINERVEDARTAPPGRFEDYPLAAWEQSFKVNVTGTFLCCQAIGSEMARRGKGSIVNVASTYAVVAPDQSLYQDANGHQAFYKSAAYPSTKGAVLSLTRYLAAYWGRQGVRVNALCPGGVENGQGPEFLRRYSERTPLGRMGRPWELGGALVFLASDASDYMTGATLLVDGGFTAW